MRILNVLVNLTAALNAHTSVMVEQMISLDNHADALRKHTEALGEHSFQLDLVDSPYDLVNAIEAQTVALTRHAEALSGIGTL